MNTEQTAIERVKAEARLLVAVRIVLDDYEGEGVPESFWRRDMRSLRELYDDYRLAETAHHDAVFAGLRASNARFAECSQLTASIERAKSLREAL